MSIPVRTRPHKVMKREDIIIGERLRGVVEETLPELIESIQQLGLLYPILVTPSGELIDGGQRLAALTAIGVDDIPVLIDSDASHDDESDQAAHLLKRELASNGVRTAFTPVQAAAARRRLKELRKTRAPQMRGVSLPERRKSWGSELAAPETGISRTTMDRVDKIVGIVEDDAQPLHVRVKAAEGLSLIEDEQAPVERVLREVTLTQQAAEAVRKYPDLAVLPGLQAQVNMASHLDSFDEKARPAQLKALKGMWQANADILADFQLCRDSVSRIEESLALTAEVTRALKNLGDSRHLTKEVAAQYLSFADRFAQAATNITHSIGKR